METKNQNKWKLYKLKFCLKKIAKYNDKHDIKVKISKIQNSTVYGKEFNENKFRNKYYIICKKLCQEFRFRFFSFFILLKY